MAEFKVELIVRMREDLPEPQGIALEKVLDRLGYKGFKNIRVGKVLEMVVSGNSKESVVEELKELSKKVFSNPVIEDFEIRISEL